MKKLLKNISILALALIVLVVLYFALIIWNEHQSYVKADIDDIVYAEPTQAAKDFDLEALINSLPQVKYEKIDYPVKETYTYNFNKYTLTVDIPEGFTAYEIPLTEKPKVVESEGLADSCQWLSGHGDVCAFNRYKRHSENNEGTNSMFWRMDQAAIFSDSKICIMPNTKQLLVNPREMEEYGNICSSSISIIPRKSGFKGVSTRNYLLSFYTRFDYQFTTPTHSFLEYNNSYYILISNDQYLVISMHQELSKEIQSLYLSIVNSIKITPQLGWQ